MKKNPLKKYLITWWDDDDDRSEAVERSRIVWSKTPQGAVDRMYLDRDTYYVYELDEDSRHIFSKRYIASQ